ncbi:peptidase E [Actinocatenispora thailandica]|uniref:dipeptidase E n=1 Tax=Actinocatenispora thailandica TaxID=227318 RepID=A0A7R7DMI6_9ACTN|nr:dipeptidase PepE [Actinocatenispora thailandica]BCJ34301.1 peptidase E [Actinocatenispora thailandica]
MDLLLLSNSRTHGHGYLEHVRDEITEFLAGATELAFVPYALRDHDGYTATVADALRPLGVTVTGVHTAADPGAAIDAAPAVFVGGGNSFRLLKTLQHTGLVEAIGSRVRSGALRYMGASAGTNMACPTLRTTNDMPITEPASFAALGLVPFQINPHYVDPDPSSTHMGETREQRITEFLEDNDVPVLGIREGGLLRVRDRSARLGGVKGARLFTRDAEPREFVPGDDVSFLLSGTPRFDAPA